jgi:hypothetical protein
MASARTVSLLTNINTKAMDTKQTVRADDFTCFCTYCTKHEVQFIASLISEYVRTSFSYLVPLCPRMPLLMCYHFPPDMAGIRFPH